MYFFIKEKKPTLEDLFLRSTIFSNFIRSFRDSFFFFGTSPFLSFLSSFLFDFFPVMINILESFSICWKSSFNSFIATFQIINNIIYNKSKIKLNLLQLYSILQFYLMFSKPFRFVLIYFSFLPFFFR